MMSCLRWWSTVLVQPMMANLPPPSLTSDVTSSCGGGSHSDPVAPPLGDPDEVGRQRVDGAPEQPGTARGDRTWGRHLRVGTHPEDCKAKEDQEHRQKAKALFTPKNSAKS